jgi:hypothetical protein
MTSVIVVKRAEQFVAPDRSCASHGHAACMWFTNVVIWESKISQNKFALGQGSASGTPMLRLTSRPVNSSVRRLTI